MYCQKIIFWTLLLGKIFTNDIIYITVFTDIFIYCKKGITYSFCFIFKTWDTHYIGRALPFSDEFSRHWPHCWAADWTNSFGVWSRNHRGTTKKRYVSAKTTVKMQIKISRQKVFRYFISYYFSWSSRDSGFWRTSELELASSHVLKNTLSRHYC